MTIPDVRSRLEGVLRAPKFSSADWLRTLDEFDEVPFFSSSKNVDFLRQLPDDARGPLLFELVLAEFDRVAATLDVFEESARYFSCLTFLDWDLVRDGTQGVPTPSLLVSPRWEVELPSLRLV